MGLQGEKGQRPVLLLLLLLNCSAEAGGVRARRTGKWPSNAACLLLLLVLLVRVHPCPPLQVPGLPQLTGSAGIVCMLPACQCCPTTACLLQCCSFYCNSLSAWPGGGFWEPGLLVNSGQADGGVAWQCVCYGGILISARRWISAAVLRACKTASKVDFCVFHAIH
ncbi:hypothetical protein COO60DRAFT_1505794 [Scenedesmus sp. NREL 46B-D3]|nr:hypothetical protein COO60DRAFT_1505794 [Scenedesmus sp. NREL 46B-D3]